MISVQCETCTLRSMLHKIGAYYVLPTRWYSLGAGGTPTLNKHFCCDSCLFDFLHKNDKKDSIRIEYVVEGKTYLGTVYAVEWGKCESSQPATVHNYESR